ncbi:hypothetical protein RB4162 [Rhodopirellula baltica SH 1]|uniref:Uncharacterized protein n=1 Tax=Rhodopirellula baltica (strain DSM 10527 / NCIMB 13988 / SH1) TaxID=243090 RepID=Q7UT22_RHOBA|nr:hypothetical protein RB4162 [Rhodopirellula baltica SH 1]
MFRKTVGREAHTAREKLEIRRKQDLSVQEPVDRWSSTETGTQEDPFSQLFASLAESPCNLTRMVGNLGGNKTLVGDSSDSIHAFTVEDHRDSGCGVGVVQPTLGTSCVRRPRC